MSPRTRFVLEALGFAAVLYAALLWPIMQLPEAWDLGYAPAAIAVILAAQGVVWPRKLLFAAVTSVLVVGLRLLAWASGLTAAASAVTTVGTEGASALQLAAFVAVQVITLGVPIAALVLFVGRKPAVLWTPVPIPRKGSAKSRKAGTAGRR